MANLNCSKISYSDTTIEDYIEDIQRVSKKLNSFNLSATEYDIHGKYNHRRIQRVFKTWNKALKAANLYYKVSKNLLGQFINSKKIGMTRFELATPATRTQCATKLRYIPIINYLVFNFGLKRTTCYLSSKDI